MLGLWVSQITVLAPVARAAHLLSVTGIVADQGKNFRPETAKYWPANKVYRRGDAFDLAVQFAVTPGWTLLKARLDVEIDGPPGFGFEYDDAQCLLQYASPMPPPPPASGSCTSDNGTVTFQRFEGISPVVEIRWKRPGTTDVRVGRYRVRARVVSATLSDQPDLDPVTLDCIDDVCEKTIHPLYTIFNPFPGSGDDHVTGLPAAALSRFATGDEDQYYSTGSDAAPRALKATLRPAHNLVFQRVMSWVDPLGTASARGAVDTVTDQAGDFVPGQWPPGPGMVLPGTNVPDLIAEVDGPRGASVCGQCMIFGSLTTAFDRSLGVPARMLTARPSFVKDAADAGFPDAHSYWNFHVWTEVWLNQVTSGDWSAHDGSKGRVTWWGITVMPVRPSGRQAAVFKDRFKVTPGNSPRGWATRADGTREEVTAAYNPRPRGRAGLSRHVGVTPAKPSMAFGRRVKVTTVYRNPRAAHLTTEIGFSLSLERLDEIIWRADNVAFSSSKTVTIPGGGRVKRTHTIPPAAYVLNGTFEARGTMTVGGRVLVGEATVRVRGGLDVRLEGPSLLTPGQPEDILVHVRNLLSRPLNEVAVEIHVPDDMAPGQTAFSADLSPREQRTFEVTVTPVDGLDEVVSAQARAAGAGLAVDSLALGTTDLMDRALTLRLARHLVARGRMRSPEESSWCVTRMPVTVQRRAGGDWRTAATTTTNAGGAYRVRLQDRPGRYRAVAPDAVVGSDQCLRAASRAARHRHG